MKRLSLTPIIALFLFLWLALAPVLAQTCVWYDTYYPSEEFVTSATHTNIYDAPDGVWSSPIGTGYIEIQFPAVEIESNTTVATFWTTQSGTTGYGSISPSVLVDGVWVGMYTSSFQSDPTFLGKWQSAQISTYSPESVGKSLTGIRFSVTRQGGSHNFLFDAFRITNLNICPETPPEIVIDCPTVDNANFSESVDWYDDDTWVRFSPTAAITNGVLSLEPGALTYQSVTLGQNTDYNAVFSVTEVTGPVDFNISLAGIDEDIYHTISAAGLYTYSLTTPAVDGPLQYTLWNQTETSATITIGYTCLYQEGETPRVCLYPLNGDFSERTGETLNYWNLYNGASYDSYSQDVYMAYETGALIASTSAYTLAAPGEDEYLILSFDAQPEAETAVVFAGLLGSTSPISYFLFADLYPDLYTYQFDLSDWAIYNDSPLTELGFAAPGQHTDGTEVPGSFWLDNVCIFISDSPPAAPTPPNYDIPPRVDFGNDLGAVDCGASYAWLSSMGVNIMYYRAVAEGLADADSWWTWLVAHFWSTASFYICAIIGVGQVIVRLLEYIINNGLNIWYWLERVVTDFPAWFSALLTWGSTSTTNIGGAFGDFFSGWGNFGTDSIDALWNVVIVGFWAGIKSYLETSAGRYIGWLDYAGVGIYNQFVDEIWNPIIYPFLQVIIDGIINRVIAAYELWNFITALISEIYGLMNALQVWLWTQLIIWGTAPISMYQGFSTGLSQPAYEIASCSGGNFWCLFLTGAYIFNSLTAHSILYPVVITGIIIGTLYILWTNVFRVIFSE